MNTAGFIEKSLKSKLFTSNISDNTSEVIKVKLACVYSEELLSTNELFLFSVSLIMDISAPALILFHL